MNKFFKTACAVISSLCIVSGVTALAACEPDTPEPPEITYETVNISLVSKTATHEYEPSEDLKEGYYEFRCSDSAVKFTVTDGHEIHPASFNLTEGYNCVLVYYSKGIIYDIGTANDETEFSVVFKALTADGKSTKSALGIEAGMAMALTLGANEKVYLHNPEEVDITGTLGGGVPCLLTGTNFKVKDKEPNESVKISSEKTIEVSTADGSAETVVLNFSTLGNSSSISVGETKTVELELMERTIRTQKGTSTYLRWEANTFRLGFNIEEAGRYKFTFTSDYEDDKLYVYGIISTGLVPVVPSRVDLSYESGGDKYNPADKSANPYIAVYEFTQNNLNAVKTYNIDFATEITDFKDIVKSGTQKYQAGDKITVTCKLEKVEEN